MSNLELSHKNLGSKLVTYLLDQAAALKEGRPANAELEIFLGYLNARKESSILAGYIACLVNGTSTDTLQGAVQEQPVRFLKELMDFCYETLNSKDLKSDKFKMELALKFFSLVLHDLVARPEPIMINKNQQALLENIMRKSNSYAGVNFPIIDQITLTSQADLNGPLVNRVVVEGLAEYNNQSEDKSHRLYLLSLDALLFRSGDSSIFSSLDLDQLLHIVEWLDELNSIPNKAEQLKPEPGIDFYSLSTFKHALAVNMAIKVASRESGDLDQSQLNQIRKFMGHLGIRKGSPELSALEKVAIHFPQEPLNPEWWSSLSLTELLEVCLDRPLLQDAIIGASRSGEWFDDAVESHMRVSAEFKDLVTAMNSNLIFGSPSSGELIKLWKLVALKSKTLQDIEASLVEEPTKNAERLANLELEEVKSQHQAEINLLSSKLAAAKGDLDSTRMALESKGNSISEARGDLELGVAKKYGEALARLIRRLERDSNKSTLTEILDREAAGLKRLDIEILPSGSLADFDPAIHDAVGIQISIGNKVEVLETGAVLTIGDKSITLMKAVVKPSP